MSHYERQGTAYDSGAAGPELVGRKKQDLLERLRNPATFQEFNTTYGGTGVTRLDSDKAKRDMLEAANRIESLEYRLGQAIVKLERLGEPTSGLPDPRP